MRKRFIQFSGLFIIMVLFAGFSGCSKPNELTEEKYCMIQKEIADLGINKYFDVFNNKVYNEMKESYVQYVKEVKGIYEKYNTTDELVEAYGNIYEEEITAFLITHPEMDYEKIHEEKYEAFTMNVYKFLEQKINQ